MSDEASDRDARFFKGGKSKAIKGLRRYLKDVDVEFTDEELGKLLFRNGETGDLGFDPDTVDDAVNTKKTPVVEPEQSATTEEPQADHTADPEPQDEPNNGDTVFSGMNHSLQNHQTAAPAAPVTRTSQRTSYTIEKNRLEQNGIKRPSAGGKCREVWDAMDELRAAQGGTIPTSDQVREMAAQRSWNISNAMIEFYQWRKFNGITGRAAK